MPIFFNLPQTRASIKSNKKLLIAFYNQACQLPCSIRTGVNIDLVRSNVRRWNRCVSVNNNFVKSYLGKKKIISYPQKILFALLRKRDAGAHPGVHKKEVTARVR